MKTQTRNRLIGFGALAATATAIILTATTPSHKYYFSSSGGDGNDGSIERPFKSISKMNNVLSTAKAGDSFFLKRGDTFYGTIKFNTSGALNKPIVVTAYGEGVNPIVSGMSKITNWTNLGNNKYEAVVGTLPYLRMVTANGEVVGKGRYPNDSWAIIQGTYSGYITDASLPTYITASGNTEVCMRTRRWVTDVYPVSKREGTKVYYSRYSYGSSSAGYAPKSAGYGYIIQNTPSCLDRNGEWCYNSSTHKLMMYSNTGTPQGVKVSGLENLVNTNSRDNLTVSDIKFEGSNTDNILVSGGSEHIKIENCDIDNSGRNAILVQATTSTNFTAIGNTITNSLNIGIELNSEYYNVIEGNTIRNSGMINGLSGSGEGGMGSGISIRHLTNKCLITHNKILSSGMCGILFKNDAGDLHSDSLEISYNVIDTFCSNKDDAAGMYAWAGKTDPPVYKSRNIHHNLILHGIGAMQGTPTTITSAYGIYGDLGFSDASIFSNTIAFCSRAGAFLNYGNERIRLYENVFYQNGLGMGTDMRGAQIAINYSNDRLVKNLNIKKNILWASGTGNLIVVTNYTGTNSTNLGVIDSNYFVYDNKKTTQFVWWMMGYKSDVSKINLAKWRAKGYDTRSDTMTVAATVPVKFAYAGDSLFTLNLGTETYIDADRKPYTGEIPISPFKAFVGRKK